MDRSEFIRKYAQEVEAGRARVFVGAGLSVEAGYPNWTRLVKRMADELELELTPESDLTGVVQYYLNRYQRDRVTEMIKDQLSETLPVPKTLKTLAKLPLREIWTTNYDKLIERAWPEQGKEITTISSNASLTEPRNSSHAVLYKMHGTVDKANDVVISKRDFELYRRKRQGFSSVLKGQFIEKTFLFLGLSFSDPNLAHLFASMRQAFGDDQKRHYAIIKKPKKGEGPDASRKFQSEKNNQFHWKTDLEKYGIHCIEVDEFDEISEILEEIEILLPNVGDIHYAKQNLRVLLIDDPEESGINLIDDLSEIGMMSGGLELFSIADISKADSAIDEFLPNVAIINPKISSPENIANWIEYIRSLPQDKYRNIVIGILLDSNWSDEDRHSIQESSFRSRIEDYYTLDFRTATRDSKGKLLDFLRLCQIDFALQVLDSSISVVCTEKDSTMSQRQVEKFSKKAIASINRLNADARDMPSSDAY